ncbi:right-handed parallel beta-helix repeat-containing protein, partial [Blautia wexlerae]|nr:right-handed parallel beta-helix repeat-containing protein [Blautia wexlerae]
SAALHAVKDNETIYIVQSHTMKDSFVYVEKTRTRKFQNVRILPEGGPRTVRMPDRHRLAFTKSSVAIGSKGSDPLTFDLSGTSVPDSDNLYCGAICANKGSSVTFENCVFQNGDQLSRWMIHGEYGS